MFVFTKLFRQPVNVTQERFKFISPTHYRLPYLSISGYHSEEKDVIRPLKFTQLTGTCRIYPPAVNIYSQELFKRNLNLSFEEALGIVNNPANYGFFNNSLSSVGKLCDVIVDKDEFRKAVLRVGKNKDN